jgi:hypothetical protein
MIYQMEITQMNVHAYLIPSLLKLEKGFFQAQEEVPGWSNEEKLEGSLVKLELLTEERLVCRMDLPGPTTSVGTRTDYSVGP